MAADSPVTAGAVLLFDWNSFEQAFQDARAQSHSAPIACIQIHFRRLRSLRGLLGQQATERAVASLRARICRVLRPQDRVLVLGEADVLILLPALLSHGHARLAIQALQRVLGESLDFEGLALRLHAEIGSAYGPDHGDSAAALQRAASLAVEHARLSADSACEAGAAAPEPLYAELRAALKANELSMVFQPIVRTNDRRTVGFEALARWQHPRTGAAVSPAVFVTLAEETGLAGELTRWSLQAALREFRPLHAADPQLHCALNLSARAFDDSGLCEQITSALALWDLPPQALLLEITETALLSDPERNAEQLAALRQLGVQVALDDFGQGYSSFGYLQFLDVGTLKIDRRFLARLDSPRERGLVQSMIQLAHRLQMRVVAEGVETESVHAILLELGCDEAQGWLYGRPQPAAHWLDVTG
jgi:EAL domain-containing protein (putative c-di-GMP-specific phosphodiesterase class I)/GGDEF domain-containing protein